MTFSVSTIRNDAVAVYRKLGVTGRTEAAVRAVELGLATTSQSASGPVVA